MTYSSGNVAEVTDYNNFVGTTSATAAASSVAATQKAGYLWGIGFGDRGYGQTWPAQTSSNVILAQHWSNLRSVLNSLATQQGSSITLPPLAVSGQVDAVSSAYATCLTTLDTNRLLAAAGGLTLTSNVVTSTRASTWGAGGTGFIQAIIQATFSSEDNTRFFFNTGGKINFNLSHPTGTSQDTNWNAILSALGTIAFNASATTRSGSGGTPASLGYYNLTTAYQTIFDGTNIGTGAYAANDVLIEALASTITGSNGAKGSTLLFRITLTDQHTNAFSDIVASGTAVNVGHTRATSNVAGIATPSLSVTTGF